MNETEILRQKVIDACKSVFDPEIPVNIYDLGLIYDIEFTEDNDVAILMTLTAPNCPEAGAIPNEVGDAVKAIDEINNVKVFLTFEPPWDREKLSEEAKLVLGLF
ncbi:MAG: iron-sulfur cluster assembly protein [Candidatus Kapabacteria bacterium]|nr:iron-sulfur cluster assembly protein [Candidatus Kapabacteria bacterium]